MKLLISGMLSLLMGFAAFSQNTNESKIQATKRRVAHP